jgi:hypothetical protein
MSKASPNGDAMRAQLLAEQGFFTDFRMQPCYDRRAVAQRGFRAHTVSVTDP